MKTYGNGTAAVAFPFLAILLAAVLSSCGGGAASGSPGIESGLTSNPVGSGSAGSFFDAKGSTSAFGIPAGLNGTVSAGQTVFSASCASCHGTGSALAVLAFDALKAKMQIGPMAGITLTDQQIADLTAWMNRNTTPPPASGGGTPNPGAGGGTPNRGTGGTGGTPGVGTGGSGDDSDDDVADDNGGATDGDDDVADDNGGVTDGDDDVADDNGGTSGGSDDVADDDGAGTDSSDDVADDNGGTSGGSDDVADDSDGATGGSDDTAGDDSSSESSS